MKSSVLAVFDTPTRVFPSRLLGDFALRFFPRSLLSFLLPLLVVLSMAAISASETCVDGSAIDEVSFFVRQTFQDVLRRDPGNEGEAYWVSRAGTLNLTECKSANSIAASGTCEWHSNAQVAFEILSAPESISKNGDLTSNNAFVTALYRLFLRRAPDSEGLKAHLSELQGGRTRVDVIAIFLSSPEYRNRFACQLKRENISYPSHTGTALGFTGHPLTQPVYSNAGISFDEQLKLVRDAGGEWYRFDVHAPSAGADFTQMDLLVSKAQAHGVQLLPILMPLLDRQHDDVQTVYKKSHDAAVSFVSRYKASIHVWELCNEQDIYTIHKAGDKGWPLPTPHGDKPSDYDPQRMAIAAALLRGLSDGVHEADSSARRLINFGGWLHEGFLQNLENAGVPYDIVGLHWYSNMGEMTCPGQSAPCPPRPTYPNVIRTVETITRNKPIWITETNYMPTESNSLEQNVAAENSYLVPTLRKYMDSPGVYPFPVIIVYELLDEPSMVAVTERQSGTYSVARSPDGKYSLAAPKPHFEALHSLFSR